MSVWLDKPEQWDKLAEALIKAGEFGFDTETHNQPDKTSPQWRTKIHCWSVGLLGTTLHTRGYRKAVGRVLPKAAMERRSIRDVFANPAITKWAHNAPHDIHSAENEKVPIVNCQDSLQLLRVCCPGRTGYGLKEAEQWALGLPKRPGFIETLEYEQDVITAKGKKFKGCICGKTPCHAKSTSDWLSPDGVWLPHLRINWQVFSPIHKMVSSRWEVTDFNPEHPTWQAWLEYSLADAVHGIELVDWIRNQRPARVVYPWNQLWTHAD